MFYSVMSSAVVDKLSFLIFKKEIKDERVTKKIVNTKIKLVTDVS